MYLAEKSVVTTQAHRTRRPRRALQFLLAPCILRLFASATTRKSPSRIKASLNFPLGPLRPAKRINRVPSCARTRTPFVFSLFISGLVCILNLELELKSEKENAEIRIENVEDYQKLVDAEWTIIYNKLEAIYNSGAKVVLSKLPIGDLATQYFADRGIFCAGRVPADDLKRVAQATGGQVQTTVFGLVPEILGKCGKFEEV